MKKILLSATVLFSFSLVFAQNINDHKVSFSYVQLPLIKIDDKFDKYEVRVEHDYLKANEDSTALFQMRKDAAVSTYEQRVKIYQSSRDSLDRSYLKRLATWEKNTNAGIKNADGSPLAKPNPPMYPEPPLYPNIKAPVMHSEYADDKVKGTVKLTGFEQGLGGSMITLNIQPIQNIRIIQTKKGTGSATKYEYKCQYTLPIGVKLETPTQGALLSTTLFTGVKYYKMKTQKSQYDHQLYMMDNEAQFYVELENYARREAIKAVNTYINNQFGYLKKNRTAEIYSVKKFKNYDYSDITAAFTKTTFALQAVNKDRDRSSAMDKLDEALEAIKEILEESTPSDNKARINSKITAMLQCNQAELLIWKAEFDEADAIVNLAINSGEGKAKRHCKDELGFYANQRQRWDANY
ncbi:MAG: hypothetical protein JKY09_05680 [Crocinitomicaceae bacterium]|nr:hypothetical protein [Crocinitomicaceae bacterium]